MIAFCTDEIQPSKVIPFTQRLLSPVRTFNREKFRSNYGVTILNLYQLESKNLKRKKEGWERQKRVLTDPNKITYLALKTRKMPYVT